MKVIFLDIDGVMNCYVQGFNWEVRKDRVPMIHDDLVERLNRIVAETGAYLVLSSTWRLASDWHDTMNKAGITDRWLGRTPRKPRPTGASFEWCERGKEIWEWLRRHGSKDVTRFCILDDDSDMLPHQKHFKTDILKGGLTEEIAQQVIAYLNAPEEQKPVSSD